MNNRGLYFEDFSAGQQYGTDRRTITEVDHINFSTAFGFFEPLFMDRAYVAMEHPIQGPSFPGR
jgi:acyl dehydratase